ncbi:hypothetical protein MNBD_NITROSPIRAE03-1693 [hydrothermal vent metagenome]|uniref:Stringent starvation protein B n=1 Tax=hydrothermal vent metagenome TaxID=652676 RepID=A0A3B1CUQ3_9ZZZZ
MEKREETDIRLNELKRHIFHELLDLAGRVFVVVRNAENVFIGNRGFLPEEEEKGLILVFNRGMKFTWDDHGIDARLVFGTTPQRCIVPAEHIMGVYCPELNTQFLSLTDTGPEPAIESTAGEEKPSKVVKVDFRKKKT